MCKDCKFKFGKDYDDIPPTLTLIRWLEGDEDKESKNLSDLINIKRWPCAPAPSLTTIEKVCLATPY